MEGEHKPKTGKYPAGVVINLLVWACENAR